MLRLSVFMMMNLDGFIYLFPASVIFEMSHLLLMAFIFTTKPGDAVQPDTVKTALVWIFPPAPRPPCTLDISLTARTPVGNRDAAVLSSEWQRDGD